jgi:hypothetical protein
MKMPIIREFEIRYGKLRNANPLGRCATRGQAGREAALPRYASFIELSRAEASEYLKPLAMSKMSLSSSVADSMP